MHKNIKNIESELVSAKSKTAFKIDIIKEVQQLLMENEEERKHIKDKIKSETISDSNAFVFNYLEADKIFHLNQIRTVCIDYRLRFLDSRFFKDGIPEEAVTKIHALEKMHQTTLEGFKIMAPSKAFQLLSYDDPLLFAPIGNDYFYLIHQWGTDITPKRKWLMKPFKNLMNFILFCLACSAIITLFVPEDNLSRSIPMASWIIFLIMFKSVVAVFMYSFFMMGKNFNTAIWDREYFNN